MSTIYELMPDHKILLSLKPEELAGIVLEYLNSLAPNADRLPKKLLHPVIAQKVYHLFLRGDYDTAVFQAFKEVEVAVRNAGGYSNQDYGTDLMRKAFHTERGILTDENQIESERKAVAHLFAGAIGLYKNPHSHRNVPVSAEETVEIIMFASHLLRIVDSRSQM